MMRIIWTLGLCMSLSVVACGKDDKKKGEGGKSKATSGKTATASSGPVAACDRRAKEFLCAEYWGKGANKDWVKKQCDHYKVPTLDKCPTDGAIGRCVRNAGTPGETQEVWFKGAEAMLAACEKSGGKKRDP